jgi:hypothetical protein
MTIQYSTTHRNNNMADITTQLGASGVLKIFTGSAPATCATADTGTLLATLTLGGTFAAAPASGVLTANAITSATAVATGTAGYWRMYPSASTTTNAVAQGTVQPQVSLTTSALTAANGNVLTFAATTGVVTGMAVSGTGILTGTTVVAVTGTTVTLSQTSTAGVSNTTAITFGGDITFTAGTAFTTGMTIGVSSFTDTATGA